MGCSKQRPQSCPAEFIANNPGSFPLKCIACPSIRLCPWDLTTPEPDGRGGTEKSQGPHRRVAGACREENQHAARGVRGTYPDPVRVVSIGVPVGKLLADPENPEWMKYSVEFCGGTHVESLGVATAFVVSKEEAISKGVRRIYGLTGLRAEQAIRDGKTLGAKVTASEKLSGDALESAVRSLKGDIDAVEVMSAPVLSKLRARVDAMAKR